MLSLVEIVTLAGAFAVRKSHQRIPAVSNSAVSNRPFSYLPLHASPSEEVPLIIREWESGEGQGILDVLMSADTEDTFNPEGTFEMDCSSEFLLKECYDPEDGGCFLVAELVNPPDDDSAIVGTAGLIVGTRIQYQTSGASQSSGGITAAIRRCSCSLPLLLEVDDEANRMTCNNILKQLLVFIEERALLAKATQVITLAYPDSTISSFASSKPSPKILESLGYQVLPQQLPGVDAIQYGKELGYR